MDKQFLATLVEYWRTRYDFDAAERRLNALPQFRERTLGTLAFIILI